MITDCGNCKKPDCECTYCNQMWMCERCMLGWQNHRYDMAKDDRHERELKNG